MSKVLLVEDDQALAMGIRYALEAENYEVIHAASVQKARQALSGKPELILLDVMLPDGNGYDLCKEIRENDALTPIIFLTAVAEEVNIVQGLGLGADDYVTKPFRVRELISRCEAVLRRSRVMQEARAGMSDTPSEEALPKGTGAGDPRLTPDVSFGSHTISFANLRLYHGEETVDLTPAEFRLLSELVRNRGIILTRNQLLEKVYDSNENYIDDNTLSVYMKRLRDKLSEDAEFIETIRGVGYRMRT